MDLAAAHPWSGIPPIDLAKVYRGTIHSQIERECSMQARSAQLHRFNWQSFPMLLELEGGRIPKVRLTLTAQFKHRIAALLVGTVFSRSVFTASRKWKSWECGSVLYVLQAEPCQEICSRSTPKACPFSCMPVSAARPGLTIGCAYSCLNSPGHPRSNLHHRRSCGQDRCYSNHRYRYYLTVQILVI